MGYAPPIVYVAPQEVASSSSPGTFPEAVSGLYPARSTENHLSPSPSAKRIMTEARIRSVEQEEEIQNRFRRGLHLDERGSGDKEEVDDLDDDVRLPYDTSDHSVSDHLKQDEVEDASTDQKTAPPAMQIPRKPVDYGIATTDRRDTNGSVPPNPVRHSEVEPIIGEHDGGAMKSSVRSGEDMPETVNGAKAPVDTSVPEHTMLKEDLSARLRDEQRHQEEEVAATRRQQGADDMAQQVEAQRVKEQRERERLEVESRQRAAAAAELQRHAEEHARQKEAERLREQEELQRQQEEQQRQEAESRRIREEIERQRKDEEEEKLRIALEEQHRMDQIRLVEEEARRKAEEEQRIAAEKEKAERVRKEGVRQALKDGKQRGGVMLRGVSLKFSHPGGG